MSRVNHCLIFFTTLLSIGLVLAACSRQASTNDPVPPSERIFYHLTPDLESQGTASGDGITVSFEKTSDWDAGNGDRGFGANITIVNETGQTLEAWDLAFDALFDITEMWNASYTQEGSRFTVTPADWNATIKNNKSRSFGFNGVYSGTFQEPTAYVLSGIPVGDQTPPGPVTASCELDTAFTVTSDWENGDGTRGFVADMHLINVGTDPVNWQLSFDFDAEITNMWNASYTREDGSYTVTPDSWNVRIEPGETRSFGFQGTYIGSLEKPQNIICNGQVGDGLTFEVQVENGFNALIFSPSGGKYEFSASDPIWNASSQTFSANVTLTNNSSEPLSGVRAILTNFTPSGVSVVNPDGYTSADEAFVEFGSVAPGEGKTVPWSIYSPEGLTFAFDVSLTESNDTFALTSSSPTTFDNDSDTTVTITGQGIRAETAFFIQSNRLEVVAWSEVQAEVIVPAGFPPASYGIMAVNPDGSRATLYPALNITEGNVPEPLDPLDNTLTFVDGYVYDYATEQPLSGAKVSIPGLSTTTLPNGYFLLQGVPAGQQAVKVEKSGYEPVYSFAEIVAEATNTLRYTALERKSTAVTNIGPEGGRHYANNGAFIDIPAGALGQTVPIQFTHTRAAETIPELPNQGYYLAFAKLGPAGLTFDKPATLFLPLQEGVVVAEGTPIRISYFDEKDKRWVQDITSGVITEIDGQLFLEYEINHFTWIGGQWFPNEVTGCVLYPDGRPAVGITTNFGVTGADGGFVGGTTSSQAGTTLTLKFFGQNGGEALKSQFYDGSSPVDFGCVTASPPSEPPPLLEPIVDRTGGSRSRCGGIGSGSISSLGLGTFQQQVAETRSLALTKSLSRISTGISNTSNYLQVDPSRTRVTVGDLDLSRFMRFEYLSNFDGSSRVSIGVEGFGPLPTGPKTELKLSVTTKTGQVVSSSVNLDMIYTFQALPVTFLEMTLEEELNALSGFLEAPLETPMPVYAKGSIVVVYRPGDSFADFTVPVPVLALDEEGIQVPLDLPSVKLSDYDWFNASSGSVPMQGGMAFVPIRITTNDIENFQLSIKEVAIVENEQTSDGQLAPQQIPVPRFYPLPIYPWDPFNMADNPFIFGTPANDRAAFAIEDFLQGLVGILRPGPSPEELEALLGQYEQAGYIADTIDYGIVFDGDGSEIRCIDRIFMAPAEKSDTGTEAKTIDYVNTADPDCRSGPDGPEEYDGPEIPDEDLKESRQVSVIEAWIEEIEAINKGKNGVRRQWSNQEREILRNAFEESDNLRNTLRDRGYINARGKLKTMLLTGVNEGESLTNLYRGHHINSVSRNPELAGEVRNITFVKQENHFKICHEGDWRNRTTGPLLPEDRLN